MPEKATQPGSVSVRPDVTDPRLAGLKDINHGFFGRVGGVSDGIYTSLNCGIGSEDERARVMENRARVARAMATTPERLVTPYQVHGIEALVVELPWGDNPRPHADALVTERPGIAIAVGTADCGPVLLAEAERGVVGVAHAGWKGALGGVLEAAVAAMARLGAQRERIVASLGPTISQANYEVGPELVARFLADDSDNAGFFISAERPGHALFDLPAYIVARLRRAGIGADATGLCTYANEERFYSFRRATHRGEPDYGRQLSAIMLRE